MGELWELLGQVINWDTLGRLLLVLLGLLAGLLPVGVWCAWWLWGVNWQKAWPVLARGGWVPLVLLAVMVAAAWSFLDPQPGHVLGLPLTSPWWQLASVTALTLVALFCGWLQGLMKWAPAEVHLDPPAVSHDHGHHGHH